MSGPFGSNQFFGKETAAAAYTIDNSCMFNDGDADYLSWTPGGAADNADKQTFSFWVKRSGLSANKQIITAPGDLIIFSAGDALDVQMGSTYDGRITTSALYRDPTAWMHFVYIYDSANAIGDQRMRLFVNGVAVSSFSTQNNPTQNADGFLTAEEHNIGRSQPDSDFYYDGYLAEFIGLDGTAADASSFGEFNSDGVWIPVDPAALTFGTNGFWLDFADSSALGNDVSGNDNDWTVSGLEATSQTTDTPTDSGTTIGNLATWNPLDIPGTSWGTRSLSEGNTQAESSSGAAYSLGTIGMQSGKFYWRVEADVLQANGYPAIGVVNEKAPVYDGGWIGGDTNAWCILTQDGGSVSGKTRTNATTSASSLFTVSAGDYIDIALDVDNLKMWFGLNGTFDGDPAAGTGEAFTVNGTSFFASCSVGTSAVAILDCEGGTPPAGFSRYGTMGIAAPTITKPSDYFLPIVYEGNGAGQRVGNFIPFTDTFAIGASCRFDKGDSDSLSNTLSTSPTSDQIFTMSAWYKRGNDVNQSADVTIFGNRVSGPDQGFLDIRSDKIVWGLKGPGISTGSDLINSDIQLDDVSSWYHIMAAVDTTQAVGSNRVKIYLNGVQVTDWGTEVEITQNGTSTSFNYGNGVSYIGAWDGGEAWLDGYLADVVWIDGQQLTPSSFGETDTSTNRWIPKDVSGLTFGNNGYYLAFASGNDLGDDTSGNGNDWTEVNLDTTNGSNQMYGTPSQNFATFGLTPFAFNEPTLSVGNLDMTSSDSTNIQIGQSWSTNSHFYFEIIWSRADTVRLGIFPADDMSNSYGVYITWSSVDDQIVNNSVTTQTSALSSPSNGDVIGVDVNGDSVQFYQNGVSRGNAETLSPGPVFSNQQYTVIIGSSGSGNTFSCNFGQWRYWDSTTLSLDSAAGGYFRYSVPTGGKAIQQDNRDANTAGITGLSWIKNRETTDPYIFQNRISGIYEYLETDAQTALTTNTNSVQRFLQQGVQIGNMDAVNTSAESYVLWQWANDGSEVTNTDGSISGDSTVRANTTAGFSIVRWSGSGSADTIGHGLGATPSLIIVKNTASASHSWYVYNTSTGNTGATFLDLSSAFATSSTYWNDTSPTSTVFTVGSNVGTNGTTAADNQYAFCWAAVEGYSSFGGYTGNGDADGPFIYTGFKPAYVLVKNTNDSGALWELLDSARNPYNPVGCNLNPDYPQAENCGTGNDLDFLASGFKVVASNPGCNGDTNVHIYLAFATNPFGGSGVAQARAF